MTDHSNLEFPDEAGYPDGVGTLTQTQTALIGEVQTDSRDEGSFSDLPFYLINDPVTKSWNAIVGDEQVGDITYTVKDDGRRIVIVSTFVAPEYRGRGVASELIRCVLTEIRAQGKTITIECPIVRTFIDKYPDFSDVVDPRNPGILRVHDGR
jgi:predicted GNAT family acetyltransferase